MVSAPNRNAYGGNTNLAAGGLLNAPWEFAAQGANYGAQQQYRDDLQRTQEMEMQLAEQNQLMKSLNDVMGHYVSARDTIANPVDYLNAFSSQMTGLPVNDLHDPLQSIMNEGRALEPSIDNIGTMANAVGNLHDAGHVVPQGLDANMMSAGDFGRSVFAPERTVGNTGVAMRGASAGDPVDRLMHTGQRVYTQDGQTVTDRVYTPESQVRSNLGTYTSTDMPYEEQSIAQEGIVDQSNMTPREREVFNEYSQVMSDAAIVRKDGRTLLTGTHPRTKQPVEVDISE